jgi:hypothetical protein
LGRRATQCCFGARPFVDTEDEIADVDLVVLFDDERAGDLSAVYIRAVGALQVDDDELAVLEHDASVPLGNVALRQDDVVSLHATDRHFGLVVFVTTLVPTLFGHHDREHVRRLFGRLRAATQRATPGLKRY